MQHIYRKLFEQYQRDKQRLEACEDPADTSRIRVDEGVSTDLCKQPLMSQAGTRPANTIEK